jgi:hypothetical protein
MLIRGSQTQGFRFGKREVMEFGVFEKRSERVRPRAQHLR